MERLLIAVLLEQQIVGLVVVAATSIMVRMIVLDLVAALADMLKHIYQVPQHIMHTQ
jgi:hypothetical protein